MITEHFTSLELTLMSAIVAIVGTLVAMGKLIWSYMSKTNKERSEEIKSSVQIQTELKGVIKHNNYLVEQLPDRIEEKFKSVMIDDRIQAAIQQSKK